MTNKELDQALCQVMGFQRLGERIIPQELDILREAAERLRQWGTGKPFGYLHWHDDYLPEGTFSRDPLTGKQKDDGWQESDLYTHPAKPDASVQFRSEHP